MGPLNFYICRLAVSLLEMFLQQRAKVWLPSGFEPGTRVFELSRTIVSTVTYILIIISLHGSIRCVITWPIKA